MLIHVQLFATPWTVAHHTPLSMEFSKQEYWSGSGLPFPSPGDIPDPGVKLRSPALSADYLLSGPSGKHSSVEEHLKVQNVSQICLSPLSRGHVNLLCIVPILVYVMPEQAHHKVLESKKSFLN